MSALVYVLAIILLVAVLAPWARRRMLREVESCIVTRLELDTTRFVAAMQEVGRAMAPIGIASVAANEALRRMAAELAKFGRRAPRYPARHRAR